MKSTRLLFLLVLIVTLACIPGGSLLGVPSTPLPTLTASPIPPTETPSPTPLPPPTSTPEPSIRRVLIVSFDGLRPDAIPLAPMPNLMALMQGGAYTLNAQTIVPSSTLPSHTSMLTGLCPAKHGVLWNEYHPGLGYANGTDLFDIAHAAGLRTVMIVGKEKLRQITEPASTDVFAYEPDGEYAIADRAIAEIDQGFGVMFVHFPTGDLNGHAAGWLSEPQLGAYRVGDDALGRMVAALGFDGLRETTLVIVTADHGGHGTSHGSDRPEDMTIPWVANGPGVQPRQLTAFVQTTDTAATAAFALGLPIPPEWDGHPVTEAFGQPAYVDAICAPMEQVP